MKLPFLDRRAELQRLASAFRARSSTLSVLYGRRRLGKSRLLLESLRGHSAVYYVGDDRDAALQRADLARQMATQIEGFDQVSYPSWSSLLDRWWSDAPARSVLALDEFPSLVRRSPELPSLLQKAIDRERGPRRHLVVCGSSQRMMHGLVLDGSAPLYGRAREILDIRALGIGWLRRALRLKNDSAVVDHWAAWGGVPRYWELAAEYDSRQAAVRSLALDPHGVLHREPERLLLDDLDDIARASSILSLVGRGAHRASEIAGGLGVPATSLSRQFAMLTNLGLLERRAPWGRTTRDSKRSRYRISEPFLRMWFRFVEPERSRLEAGQVSEVARFVEKRWSYHLGEVWEDLARASVARLAIFGRRWNPASSWWGPGLDREPLELDIVAESADDPTVVLCGEAKLSASSSDVRRALAGLRERAARCPVLQKRTLHCGVWVLRRQGTIRNREVVSTRDVVA